MPPPQQSKRQPVNKSSHDAPPATGTSGGTTTTGPGVGTNPTGTGGATTQPTGQCILQLATPTQTNPASTDCWTQCQQAIQQKENDCEKLRSDVELALRQNGCPSRVIADGPAGEQGCGSNTCSTGACGMNTGVNSTAPVQQSRMGTPNTGYRYSNYRRWRG